MNVDMRQEDFSNCKCQQCGHFALSEKFSPEVVPLEESNHPYVKFTIDSNDSGITIDTINYKCPICGSPLVEPYFGTELN